MIHLFEGLCGSGVTTVCLNHLSYNVFSYPNFTYSIVNLDDYSFGSDKKISKIADFLGCSFYNLQVPDNIVCDDCQFFVNTSHEASLSLNFLEDYKKVSKRYYCFDIRNIFLPGNYFKKTIEPYIKDNNFEVIATHVDYLCYKEESMDLLNNVNQKPEAQLRIAEILSCHNVDIQIHSIQYSTKVDGLINRMLK